MDIPITWILAGLAILLVLFIISSYNRLVKRRNQVDNAFASIDATLKKRFDLIPNLVETVKQYMTHERDTLNEIVKIREDKANTNLSDEEKMDVENSLSKMMGQLMVKVEQYPDLKASANFIQLQAAWNEVEGQISAARRFYNSAVTSYNNSREVFPTVLFSGVLGFQPRKVFEIPETERQSPDAKNLWN